MCKIECASYKAAIRTWLIFFSSKFSSSICAGMSGCRSNNFSTSSYLYLNGFLHKPNNDPKQVMNHFHLKWFAIFLVEISTFSMFFLIGSAMLLSFTQSNSLWERLKMYTHTCIKCMQINMIFTFLRPIGAMTCIYSCWHPWLCCYIQLQATLKALAFVASGKPTRV